MMQTTAMDRLAAARPPDHADTAAIVPFAERAALLRSIVATDPPPAAGRPRLAGPLRRAVAVAASAGAVLAGIAVADATREDRAGRDPAARAQVGVPVRVLDRIQLAVEKASGGVVHVQSDFGNGVLWETWLDDATGRWRSASRTADGRPQYEHQVDVDDTGATVVVVSHRDRAWWTYHAPEGRGEAKLYLTPDEIKAQIADGTLEEVQGEGAGAGAGPDEIHLRGQAVEKAPGSYTAAIDLWVDRATYLPVRSTATLRDKTPATSTYTWLSRTDDALARTRVAIPPDYPQLPGAPETGAG